MKLLSQNVDEWTEEEWAGYEQASADIHRHGFARRHLRPHPFGEHSPGYWLGYTLRANEEME